MQFRIVRVVGMKQGTYQQHFVVISSVVVLSSSLAGRPANEARCTTPASPPVTKSGDSAPSGVYTGPVTRSRKRKRRGEINVLYRNKTLKMNVDIDDHSVLDIKLKIQAEEGLTPEQLGGLMFSGSFLEVF